MWSEQQRQEAVMFLLTATASCESLHLPHIKDVSCLGVIQRLGMLTKVAKNDILILGKHLKDTKACTCLRAKVTQSCPALCDPMDCSPPGSSVHGILQARILEWVARPSSRGTSRPRNRTHVSYVSRISSGGFFKTSATWEALCRLTLCFN